MSDASDPKAALVEEVREQTDVGDLLAGDGIEDQLDGASLGRTLGGSLGALAGRQLGRRVARKLRDWLPFISDPDRERSLPGRVLGALVVAVVRTLSRPQFRGAVGDAFEEFVERREQAREAAESATETAEETAEGAADAAEGAADAATEAGSDAVEALQGDTDDLKRETYRELLDVLSYSDLQSVAKSVDVKANLGREEMTDAIVEKFAEEDAQDAAEGAESSDGGEGGSG